MYMDECFSRSGESRKKTTKRNKENISSSSSKAGDALRGGSCCTCSLARFESGQSNVIRTRISRQCPNRHGTGISEIQEKQVQISTNDLFSIVPPRKLTAKSRHCLPNRRLLVWMRATCRAGSRAPAYPRSNLPGPWHSFW